MSREEKMINCTANSTTNFSENSTTHFIFIVEVCTYGINIMFGFPLYSYIIWLIITGAGSGIASDFFFLNISVCEIGSCFNSLILVFNFVAPFQHYIKYLMAFAQFLSGLCITGRPLFQCVICVERYLAVIHPVTFLKYKPLRYKFLSSAVVWLIILASCVICGFLTTLFNIYCYIIFILIQFLVFLSVQLFCCLAVLRALKQSGPGERGREREEENHMKKRAFYLILITTVTMVLTYVPIIFAGFSDLLTQCIMRDLWSFSFIFFLFGSFVQPVLYLQRTGKLYCLFT